MSASPAARLVRMLAPPPATPISDDAAALEWAADLLVLWRAADSHLGRHPFENLGYRRAINKLRYCARTQRELAAKVPA